MVILAIAFALSAVLRSPLTHPQRVASWKVVVLLPMPLPIAAIAFAKVTNVATSGSRRREAATNGTLVLRHRQRSTRRRSITAASPFLFSG